MHAPTAFVAATGGAGIVRATRNGGTSWKVTTALTDEDVRCLAASPRDPGVLYAGTQGRGVLRSMDWGRSWEPSGLEDRIVKALTVSPVTPGLVFAGLKPAEVWVSGNGGATWDECDGFRRVPGRRTWWSPAEPPWIGYVQALAASPTDADVVHAGIEVGGVLTSTDGGASWTRFDGAIRDCHTLAAHAEDGSWFYQGGSGVGAAATVSRTAGREWHKARAPGEPHYGWAVAADPADPETWYFTAAPGPGQAHGGGPARAHVYRMHGTDGAPERLQGGLPDPLDSMPYGLATHPRAPGHVWLGLANGEVWHGVDQGDAWQRLDVDLGSIRHGFLAL